MAHESITKLAADILHECSLMERQCQTQSIAPPSLNAGTSTAFWSEESLDLAAARSKTLGMLSRLTTLLQGPHDFLHEVVAPNWDHGALYAFLQSKQLEHIASSGGRASLSSLSERSEIPKDKLIRILELLRCRDIIHEPEDGIFSLTAVSEDLLHDEDFRSWVEFQLFETRIASAHLADVLLKPPNGYSDGTSGFKEGPLMTIALDPADSLIRRWFQHRSASERTKVVEIGGRYGFASISLVKEKPELSFEVRCDSLDFLNRGKALVDASDGDRIAFTHISSTFESCPPVDENNVLVYVIRNLFWNWADEKVVELLQKLLPTLKASPATRILVTDGVSPLPNEFPSHVEIAYRRRDITTMTMHNVKQRTQAEWLGMFALVDPAIEVIASRPRHARSS
ncbi:hypothetical protein ACMFMF_009861 [Clarireedia jacksonii]